MKKVLDRERHALLERNRECKGLRDRDISSAFDAVDTELSNMLAKLEAAARNLAAASKKLPNSGKLLELFAGMVRDYGDRLRGEVKEESRIILPADFSANGSNGA